MQTGFCSPIRCITTKCLILFAVALLALGVLATPASAQTCLQDEYSQVQSQKLQCTANDVRVAKVINLRSPDGTALFTCVGGSPTPFVADFLVQTTSTKARSNIGLYFANSDITNQADALTGSCSDNIIAPPHPGTGGVTACLGSGGTAAAAAGSCSGCGTYEELDTGS